jgi:hypothetical protein
MTSSELLPATVLSRKAVVYVRQSTQSQVMTNLESQRRQYDLVEVARAPEGRMDRKSDEEITLFVRDEQTWPLSIQR